MNEMGQQTAGLTLVAHPVSSTVFSHGRRGGASNDFSNTGKRPKQRDETEGPFLLSRQSARARACSRRHRHQKPLGASYPTTLLTCGATRQHIALRALRHKKLHKMWSNSVTKTRNSRTSRVQRACQHEDRRAYSSHKCCHSTNGILD